MFNRVIVDEVFSYKLFENILTKYLFRKNIVITAFINLSNKILKIQEIVINFIQISNEKYSY